MVCGAVGEKRKGDWSGMGLIGHWGVGELSLVWHCQRVGGDVGGDDGLFVPKI